MKLHVFALFKFDPIKKRIVLRNLFLIWCVICFHRSNIKFNCFDRHSTINLRNEWHNWVTNSWRIGDSNSWLPACKAGALPTVLIPQVRRIWWSRLVWKIRTFPDLSRAPDLIWTDDQRFTKPLLYHWATRAFWQIWMLPNRNPKFFRVFQHVILYRLHDIQF